MDRCQLRSSILAFDLILQGDGCRSNCYTCPTGSSDISLFGEEGEKICADVQEGGTRAILQKLKMMMEQCFHDYD